jgi:hypothetical protein
MTKLRWMPVALLVFLSAAMWAQSDERMTAPQATLVTLLMDWSRGSSHYGPDFIFLHRPCEAATGHGCECTAEFKVMSSKQNSKEFADYVTSFEHGKVPVVYNVLFNDQGQAAGVRLVGVGQWKSDRFHVNDGLLGVRVTFSGKGQIGQVQHAPIHGVADCFPPKPR